MGFIPESHNDMIFSIICEELGLFGAVCLILVFVALIFRMLLIALNTEDLFGSLVVIGFMTHIAIQVFINIAVVTNTIPPTIVASNMPECSALEPSPCAIDAVDRPRDRATRTAYTPTNVQNHGNLKL